MITAIAAGITTEVSTGLSIAGPYRQTASRGAIA
jgi:hypothetical protein